MPGTPPFEIVNADLWIAFGDSAGISREILEFGDEDTSNPSQIVYSITSGPGKGYVSRNDVFPPAFVTSFTQAHVNAGSIAYVSFGETAGDDAFTFKVADQLGNEVQGQTFTILVGELVAESPNVIRIGVLSSGRVANIFAARRPLLESRMCVDFVRIQAVGTRTAWIGDSNLSPASIGNATTIPTNHPLKIPGPVDLSTLFVLGEPGASVTFSCKSQY